MKKILLFSFVALFFAACQTPVDEALENDLILKKGEKMEAVVLGDELIKQVDRTATIGDVTFPSVMNDTLYVRVRYVLEFDELEFPEGLEPDMIKFQGGLTANAELMYVKTRGEELWPSETDYVKVKFNKKNTVVSVMFPVDDGYYRNGQFIVNIYFKKALADIDHDCMDMEAMDDLTGDWTVKYTKFVTDYPLVDEWGEPYLYTGELDFQIGYEESVYTTDSPLLNLICD